MLFLCTQLNSAVTTLVVGNLKALLTTALGFFLFGKVQLSALGLGGVALNSVGGILYSVAKFVEHRRLRRLRMAVQTGPVRSRWWSRNRSGNRCAGVRARRVRNNRLIDPGPRLHIPLGV